MSEAYTPAYTFTPQCESLLAAIDLPRETVIEAHQRRSDSMLVPTVPAHLYEIQWHADGRAVFTSSEISRMEWHVDRARPAEVTFHMGLWLQPQLPAGPIAPGMEMDHVWTRIVDSFGTPLTCHDDFSKHLRYTGRWDKKPPRVAGEEADAIIDGGFDQERGDAKYVWALSRQKYESWLQSSSEPPGSSRRSDNTTIDTAHWPRLVFARMRPTALRQSVVVRADIGEAAVRLVCSRCSIVEIDDPPFYHPTMKCLLVFGAELLDPERLPSQLAGKEYVIPIHFITDLRPGPNVFLTGDAAPQRSAILPNEFRPGNKMSLKAIESFLQELTP
jgi:hypothetical protein